MSVFTFSEGRAQLLPRPTLWLFYLPDYREVPLLQGSVRSGASGEDQEAVDQVLTGRETSVLCLPTATPEAAGDEPFAHPATSLPLQVEKLTLRGSSRLRLRPDAPWPGLRGKSYSARASIARALSPRRA